MDILNYRRIGFNSKLISNSLYNKLTAVKITLLFFILSLPCYNLISQEVQQGKSYQEGIDDCNRKLTLLKAKIPGSTFVRINGDCLEGYYLPLLEFKDLEGREWNNDSIRGKKNIFNFWFTTCPPCLKEIPLLNQLKDQYGTKGINYFAIGKDSESDILEFLEHTPFNYTIVPNGEDIINKTFQSSWGYPMTIITNENLVIVEVINGAVSEDVLKLSMSTHLLDK
jgi:thiol-disulfide isomerase/thioredoxin